MIGEMAGFGDALKFGSRIVSIIERLSSDPNVKRKLQTDGKYLGEVTIGDYKIKFDIIDMKKQHLQQRSRRRNNGYQYGDSENEAGVPGMSCRLER